MNEMPTVKLRALEPEDLDTLYRIENDNDLWNVGVTNVPHSRFALHEYIASATGDIYVDKQVRLMIIGPDDDVVGIVDLCNFNPCHQRAEVGIVIEKPHRGRGYAREALRQLTDYAHRVLHIHQLYALVSVDNTYCLQLFDHLGFVREALLHDWLFDGDQYHDAVLLAIFL